MKRKNIYRQLFFICEREREKGRTIESLFWLGFLLNREEPRVSGPINIHVSSHVLVVTLWIALGNKQIANAAPRLLVLNNRKCL